MRYIPVVHHVNWITHVCAVAGGVLDQVWGLHKACLGALEQHREAVTAVEVHLARATGLHTEPHASSSQGCNAGMAACMQQCQSGDPNATSSSQQCQGCHANAASSSQQGQGCGLTSAQWMHNDGAGDDVCMAQAQPDRGADEPGVQRRSLRSKRKREEEEGTATLLHASGTDTVSEYTPLMCVCVRTPV